VDGAIVIDIDQRERVAAPTKGGTQLPVRGWATSIGLTNCGGVEGSAGAGYWIFRFAGQGPFDRSTEGADSQGSYSSLANRS
jgi:hypothetical protein